MSDSLSSEIVKALQDFAKEYQVTGVALFDDSVDLLFSTYEYKIQIEELKAFANAFSSEEDTFASGLMLNGVLYDVHRFYANEKPGLIYGRREGDKPTTEGVGLIRVLQGDCTLGKTIYAVCSYKLPCLSTRAITNLRNLFREHLLKK
ncbi:hypothetical protein ABK040_015599 [Willaertia magna]